MILNRKNWIVNLILLVIFFLFLSFFPDLTFFTNAYIGQGLLVITTTTIITGTLYFISKLNKYDFNEYFKGYFLFILSFILSAIISLIS